MVWSSPCTLSCPSPALLPPEISPGLFYFPAITVAVLVASGRQELGEVPPESPVRGSVGWAGAASSQDLARLSQGLLCGLARVFHSTVAASTECQGAAV